jgi:hypothetical protein
MGQVDLAQIPSENYEAARISFLSQNLHPRDEAQKASDNESQYNAILRDVAKKVTQFCIRQHAAIDSLWTNLNDACDLVSSLRHALNSKSWALGHDNKAHSGYMWFHQSEQNSPFIRPNITRDSLFNAILSYMQKPYMQNNLLDWMMLDAMIYDGMMHYVGLFQNNVLPDEKSHYGINYNPTSTLGLGRYAKRRKLASIHEVSRKIEQLYFLLTPPIFNPTMVKKELLDLAYSGIRFPNPAYALAAYIADKNPHIFLVTSFADEY